MTKQTAGHSSRFTLWRMRLAGDEVRCVVAATPFDVEAQIRMNGSVLYSYRFREIDELESWSDARVAAFSARGWRLDRADEYDMVEPIAQWHVDARALASAN